MNVYDPSYQVDHPESNSSVRRYIAYGGTLGTTQLHLETPSWCLVVYCIFWLSTDPIEIYYLDKRTRPIWSAMMPGLGQVFQIIWNWLLQQFNWKELPRKHSVPSSWYVEMIGTYWKKIIEQGEAFLSNGRHLVRFH